MDSSKVEYLKQFKGGSMAKTFLIKKGENLYVRKEVEDESSLGLKKLEKQVDWILELEDEVAEIFPKVIEKNFGEKFGYYDMTYHQMPSFKDYLIEKGEVDDDIKRILSEIISYCSKIANKEYDTQKDKLSYVEKSHFNKMIERCEIVAKQSGIFKAFFNAPSLYINGKKYLNVKQIIDEIKKDTELMKLLTPKKWYRSHGDFTFQNILTDGKEFKIIDPRGEGEDTLYYDLSKLFQSCNAKYDLFFEGNYDCQFSLNDYSINYKIKEYEQLFDEVLDYIKKEIPKTFSLDKNWEIATLFYEGSHMVAMAPFRYEESLEFTLVAYAIGVKILNEVLEKWNRSKSNG